MDGNQTGVTVFMVAIIINGLGSLLGSANFAATIVNMRAPGMSLWKMPSSAGASSPPASCSFCRWAA
nr:hypothetical protein [Deinococcus cavernae]